MTMKKLLFVVLLSLSFSAHANQPNALCAPNKAGGRVIVTTKQLEDKRGIVIATGKNGDVMYGAWQFIGKRTIHIEWDNGASSVLDLLSLVPCRY